MILPYTINIPDERLAAIRDKVAAYDWTQLPDLGGWKSGVGVSDLKRLTRYWLESYDWRQVEKHLNQLPNFITEIEGEHLHFLHVRGRFQAAGAVAPRLARFVPGVRGVA